MSVVFKKVRFNLNKERDRAAYEALSYAETSENHFMINALNAYGRYLSEEAQREELLRRIDAQIRRSVQSVLLGAVNSPTAQPVPSKPEADTNVNEEIADDFLRSFL